MLQYSQTVLGPMLHFDTESTICAISTGKEGAPRGAIRITGPDSMRLVRSAFSVGDPIDSEGGNGGNQGIPHGSRATRCIAQVDLARLGRVPVELFLWPDHRSYTGQPSAEVHTVGAPVVLEELQNHLLQMGAKLAQPGEFTLRAFLAGRLDLTQCEGVLGVIHASNTHALDVALKQLAGGLAGPLKNLRQDLIHTLADIEAGLDFVDEDISFISTEQIIHRLSEGVLKVDVVLEQMESRSGQRHVLQAAIVGPPNAGKSSLLNALAAQPIAIVSPVPGTTRDYLRFRMQLGGVLVDLLDTAGTESIEENTPRGLAQFFTQEQMQNADLILLCEPLSAGSSSFTNEANIECRQQDSKVMIPIPATKPCWKLWTKSDIAGLANSAGSTPGSPVTNQLEANDSTGKQFRVSSLSGDGIDVLLVAIEQWAQEQMRLQSEVVPMTAERCWASLVRTREALIQAIQAAEQGHGDEVTASEIRIALDELGVVAGTVYNDDVLDALFSRFCIGK